MTKCNKSKCLISVIAVFAFMFVYDMIVHGFLLAGAYAATASMWRSEAEMQSLMWMCFVYHGALAFLFAALYKMTCCPYVAGSACEVEDAKTKSKATKTEEKKSCPIKRGVCFGAIVGLILAVTNGSAYMHIPIPASLAISWFFASLFQGVGVGVVLALINNKKGCTANG